MTAPEHDLRIRIFFSSPGDVEEEREKAAEVVRRIQDRQGEELGINLISKKWETDTYPAIGRPQGVINQQIGEYEIFVGIFWNRYGSPTGEADSGTVEEFEKALEERDPDGIPAVLFYFCQKPAALESIQELEQKMRVVQFREEYGEKAGLYKTYETLGEFEQKLYDGLLETIRDVREQLLQEGEVVTGVVAEADAQSVESASGAVTAPEFLNESLEIIASDFDDFGDTLSRVLDDADVDVNWSSEDLLSADVLIDGQARNSCRIRKQERRHGYGIVYHAGALAASSASGGSAYASAEMVMHDGRPRFLVSNDDPDCPDGQIDVHKLAEYFWSLFVRPVESDLALP